MTMKMKYFKEDTVEYSRLVKTIQEKQMATKRTSSKEELDELRGLQEKLTALELKMGIKNGSTS